MREFIPESERKKEEERERKRKNERKKEEEREKKRKNERKKDNERKREGKKEGEIKTTFLQCGMMMMVVPFLQPVMFSVRFIMKSDSGLKQQLKSPTWSGWRRRRGSARVKCFSALHENLQ